MKKCVKITKTIINIITTIIIVLGIIFIGLYCFGIEPYVVESGSMEPTIKTGSVCIINKKANYNDMQVGDIIAFKIDSGAYATHRIESITNDGFETKGDANSAPDQFVTTKENFVGKNIFWIPNIGFMVKAIQRPSGKIILGTVIVVLFLAGILIGEPSKKKKNSNNPLQNQ